MTDLPRQNLVGCTELPNLPASDRASEFYARAVQHLEADLA